jgi:hypothetical protein
LGKSWNKCIVKGSFLSFAFKASFFTIFSSFLLS